MSSGRLIFPNWECLLSRQRNIYLAFHVGFLVNFNLKSTLSLPVPEELKIKFLFSLFFSMPQIVLWRPLRHRKTSIIRQNGKSQNGCFKKTKHVKFSGKRTFLTPWYKHVRFSENLACFVFLKHPFWDSPFCLIIDEKRVKTKIYLNTTFWIAWDGNG